MPGRIVIPGGRPPDLNGDGYADVVLWRSARPAPTLDALANAARTGGWVVVVTVHLFEPEAGRFAARPVVWFRAAAPLESVLAAGVEGPYAQVRFNDVDGDGGDEMIVSGAGDEIAVWKYTGALATAPSYRVKLEGPVLDVPFSVTGPETGWLAIVKTPRAFHALTLP